MPIVQECIGLLSSMVNSGEKHSATSMATIEQALTASSQLRVAAGHVLLDMMIVLNLKGEDPAKNENFMRLKNAIQANQ